MATADHPDIPFVEARTINGGPAYTLGRPDGPPIWVVVHDMEFPERDDAAEWTAAYFARGADGRSVSSHYTADRNSIVQCVRLADVAWTVGNRPGNYRGINWELAGYASQNREQWLDDFGRAMLVRVAVVMRRDMDRYGIPVHTLTDVAVRSFAPGITSHAQLGRVFGGTDHTDPGAGFPWDYLLELLGEEDMTPEQDRRLYNADRINTALLLDLDEVSAIRHADGTLHAYPLMIVSRQREILRLLTAGGIPPAGEVDLSVEAIGEIRDAVADLGEGGAAQVRADTP